MNNPQQPASPAKVEEQLAVVMLDTERYQELLDCEELLRALESSDSIDWNKHNRYDCL